MCHIKVKNLEKNPFIIKRTSLKFFLMESCSLDLPVTGLDYSIKQVSEIFKRIEFSLKDCQTRNNTRSKTVNIQNQQAPRCFKYLSETLSNLKHL